VQTPLPPLVAIKTRIEKAHSDGLVELGNVLLISIIEKGHDELLEVWKRRARHNGLLQHQIMDVSRHILQQKAYTEEQKKKAAAVK
jgi:hypothetical protein